MTNILAEGTIFKVLQGSTVKGYAFATTRLGGQKQYWLLNGIDKPLPGNKTFTIDVELTNQSYGQFIDFITPKYQNDSKFVACTITEYADFSAVPAVDQAKFFDFTNGTHLVQSPTGSPMGRATYAASSAASGSEYWTLSPGWMETGRKDLKDGSTSTVIDSSDEGDSFVVVESSVMSLP